MSTKNVILGLVGIMAFVLFYAWQKTEVLKTSYEIETLNGQKKEVNDKNKFLQVEVASLKSLDRIEKISREQLGLVAPDKFEILDMDNKPVDNAQDNKDIDK